MKQPGASSLVGNRRAPILPFDPPAQDKPGSAHRDGPASEFVQGRVPLAVAFWAVGPGGTILANAVRVHDRGRNPLAMSQAYHCRLAASREDRARRSRRATARGRQIPDAAPADVGAWPGATLRWSATPAAASPTRRQFSTFGSSSGEWLAKSAKRIIGEFGTQVGHDGPSVSRESERGIRTQDKRGIGPAQRPRSARAATGRGRLHLPHLLRAGFVFRGPDEPGWHAARGQPDFPRRLRLHPGRRDRQKILGLRLVEPLARIGRHDSRGNPAGCRGNFLSPRIELFPGRRQPARRRPDPVARQGRGGQRPVHRTQRHRHHRPQSDRVGQRPAGRDRRIERRRHHQQGPQQHHHDLERRRHAAVRLYGRGGDRSFDHDAHAAGAGERGAQHSGAHPPRRADRPLRNGAPPQGWHAARHFPDRLATGRLRRARSWERRKSPATSPTASGPSEP